MPLYFGLQLPHLLVHIILHFFVLMETGKNTIHLFNGFTTSFW